MIVDVVVVMAEIQKVMMEGVEERVNMKL